MCDKSNLPYNDAVVNEIQRYACVIPITPIHTTQKEIQLRGYNVSKGSKVIANLDFSLFEIKYFPDLFNINPESFLNKNYKQESFIPFRLGKRSCAGIILVKMELFLFFTCLIKNF
jgi:cytochrome P450